MCAIAQQNERTQLIERRRERRRVRNKFGIVADDIVQLIYDQLMQIVSFKIQGFEIWTKAARENVNNNYQSQNCWWGWLLNERDMLAFIK